MLLSSQTSYCFIDQLWAVDCLQLDVHYCLTCRVPCREHFKELEEKMMFIFASVTNTLRLLAKRTATAGTAAAMARLVLPIRSNRSI